MKRFKSLGSLVDDSQSTGRSDLNSSVRNNWRRLFKKFSFNKRNDYTFESQLRQQLSRFQSHVNLFDDTNSDSRIEENIIAQFIEDELLLIQNLSNFREILNYVHLKNKLELDENVRKFIDYNSEKFLPALQEAKNFNEFVNAFRENLNLYEIYKNLLISCMNSLMQFSIDNNFEENKDDLITGLNLAKKRLNDQITSLNNISSRCSHTDIKNKITILVAIIKATLGAKVEDIRLILYEIVKFKKDHLSKCKFFVNEIIPKIMGDVKFSHKSQLIIGNIPEILKAEEKLYDLIRRNFDFDKPNKLVKAFLRYEAIFDLYKKDTVIDINLKTAFCEAHNQIDPKYFSLIIDHLFHIKNLFERLCCEFEKSKKDCSDLKELIQLINDSLHHLDNNMAVGQIYGSTEVDLQKYGKVILRSKFRVRYDKNPAYDGMVFLFDSGIVLTKEGNLTDVLCGYVFEKFIPIDQLAFNDIDNTSFRIYKQEKLRKSEFHILVSNERTTVFNWKMVLKKILFDQLLQKKEEAHRRRAVAKSVIF